MYNINTINKEWQFLTLTKNGVCMVLYEENAIYFTMPKEDYCRESIEALWLQLMSKGVNAMVIYWESSEVLCYGVCSDFEVV